MDIENRNGTKSRMYQIIGIILVFLIAGVGVFGQTNTQEQYVKNDNYNKGYKLGLEAYIYGLPLLVTNATFQTMTSVNVTEGAFGPVNKFNNVRVLNTAGSKEVVATSATNLSSIAWLDLTDGPIVLHIPEVEDHLYCLALIDPYTENLVTFGTASKTRPGDYVIVDPSQKNVLIPPGTQRIDVDYSRIWIIGSTQLKGPEDITNVNKIQDGYTLTPLSQYGKVYTLPVPSKAVTTITKYSVPTDIRFFDILGQQLSLFPPPARDKEELKKFATVGIGPGLKPSQNTQINSDTRRGLNDAVAAGPTLIKKYIQEESDADFSKHNGYMLGGFGQYGTNYQLRAVVSQVGLGAFTSPQAIYALAWTDHERKSLDGSKSYIIHMSSPPPTNEGWSLTLYNLKGAMIQNSINRYAFTNVSDLTKNKDGSIDFYLQSEKPLDPAQQKNWLPTANGQGFEVMWRLFAPQTDKIKSIIDGTGWQPPVIQFVP
ncbi:MAG: DUF1254 domain-containing protein [Fusobacteria bacterium]|nr:DUF1254 domain-containing protein [Fusobacteriota bacterium]